MSFRFWIYYKDADRPQKLLLKKILPSRYILKLLSTFDETRGNIIQTNGVFENFL